MHGLLNEKFPCLLPGEFQQKLSMRSSNSTGKNMKIHRQLPVQNNDVILHTQAIINNFESFYKVLITYLIEQQYRRSEEAQQVRNADAILIFM